MNDFHEWTAWSPWEDVDPDMQREYSGARSGVGASYSWRGNRKAGAGRMEIIESTPDTVRIALSFLKPFKAENRIEFDLVDAADATTAVRWGVAGKQTGLMAIFARLYPMDKVVGQDFEKGLRRLKRVAETQ